MKILKQPDFKKLFLGICMIQQIIAGFKIGMSQQKYTVIAFYAFLCSHLELKFEQVTLSFDVKWFRAFSSTGCTQCKQCKESDFKNQRRIGTI